MTPFVLVHGMWHGGWCWNKVVPLLRAAGHEVYTPTLTGVGERAHLHYPDIDLHTHIQDVANVLDFEDLRDVILVGHSLSGFMIPAVAERVPARIAHLVNLDGHVPADGQTFKDLLPDYWEDFRQRGRASGDEWWVPPIPEWTFSVTGDDLEWLRSKLTPHPLKTWETRLSFTDAAARLIPRTFIACSEDKRTADDITADRARFANLGWQYRFIPAGHDAMITAPETLTNILLELV